MAKIEFQPKSPANRVLINLSNRDETIMVEEGFKTDDEAVIQALDNNPNVSRVRKSDKADEKDASSEGDK